MQNFESFSINTEMSFVILRESFVEEVLDQYRIYCPIKNQTSNEYGLGSLQSFLKFGCFHCF